MENPEVIELFFDTTIQDTTVRRNVMVDTGTDLNIISEAEAQALGYSPVPTKDPIELETLGGKVETLGEIELSFSIDKKKDHSTTAVFYVLRDIPGYLPSQIRLGRKFLINSGLEAKASLVHRYKSLEDSTFADNTQLKPLIDQSVTKPNTTQARIGQPSEVQATRWASPELQVSERRDPRRRHDADIIFIPADNRATKDSEVSPQIFGWSLDLLPNDTPGARIIHFKWAGRLKAERDYSMLGQLLLRNLIHERCEKASVSMVPIVFVCQGHGRVILQVMLNAATRLSNRQDDGPFNVEGLSYEAKEVLVNLSRELLQRVKSILVFDTKIGIRLRRDLKSCGRLFEPKSQIPIIYLRPTELLAYQEGILRLHPFEAGASVIYLAKFRNLVRRSDWRDPNYLIVLQLILAQLVSKPENTQEASHIPKDQKLQPSTATSSLGDVKVSDGSTLYAASTGRIEVRDKATAYAFSTGDIDAVDSTLYITNADHVTVSGNSVVQIQDCSRISAWGEAMVRVDHANSLNAQSHGHSMITVGPVASSDNSALSMTGRDGKGRGGSSAYPRADAVLQTVDADTTDIDLPSPEHSKSVDVSSTPPNVIPSMQPSGLIEAENAVTLPIYRYNSFLQDDDVQLQSDLDKDYYKVDNLRLTSLRPQCKQVLDKVRSTNSPNTGVAPNLPAAWLVHMSIEWEMLKFLKQEFTPAQLIADIFVLIGSTNGPEGSTCSEFMESHWPTVGDFVLETTQLAISKLNEQVGPQCSYSLKKPTRRHTLELREFSWFTDQSKDILSLTFRGKEDTALDFVEAISWLGAALRPTNSTPAGFSVSDINGSCEASEDNSHKLSLRCWPRLMDKVEAVTGPCWHSLFKNPTIVNYINQDSRPTLQTEPASSVGYGLKLKLRDLIALSGADLLMEYNGGLIYFGYSTILVPICTLPSGDIQWHLLRQIDADEMIPLTMIDTDEVCRNRELIKEEDDNLFAKKVAEKEKAILFAKAHYLGLWPEALIALGTEGDHNYTALTHGAFSADKKVKISDTYSATLGGTLTGPNFGLGRAAAYAPAQTTVDFNTKDRTFLKVLKTFKKKAVLIYESDPARKRAWLVPKLSVVLHVAHLYFRSAEWDGDSLLQYADPAVDGDAAAWKILTPKADWTSVSGYTGTTEKDRREVGWALTRIVLNMLKFDAKAVSQSTASRIHGYDLAALTSDPKFRPVRTDFEFLVARQGWWLLTEEVPIYLCQEISPPVRRSDDGENEQPQNLPGNHLICPMACLNMVNKNTGKLVAEGNVSGKIHFHSPHEPFTDCTCSQCSETPRVLDQRARVQYLVKSEGFARKWDRMSDHMGSAVLISPQSGVLHKALPRKAVIGAALEPDGSAASLVASLAEDVSDLETEAESLEARQQITMTLRNGKKEIIYPSEEEVDDGQPESSGINANQHDEPDHEYLGSNGVLPPKALQPVDRHEDRAFPIDNDDEEEPSSTVRKGKERALDPPLPTPPNANSRTEPSDKATNPDTTLQENHNDGKTHLATNQPTKRKGRVRKVLEPLLPSFLGKQPKSSKDKAKKKKNPAPLTRPITPK